MDVSNLNVELPTELRDEIKAASKADGVLLRKLVEDALRYYLLEREARHENQKHNTTQL